MKKTGAKKIFLELGRSCNLNLVLIKQICYFLLENGHKIIDNPKNADFILYSGCGLFPDWLNHSVARIKGYRDKRIIIVGCLSSERQLIWQDKKISIIGAKETHLLEKILKTKIGFADLNYSAIYQKDVLNTINRLLGLINQSPYIYLQDITCLIGRGCASNCSYCGEKKSIGFIKSKKIKNVISEIKKQIKTGQERVLLLADDCGCYGLDIGTNLFSLIDVLFENFPAISLGLGHINPIYIIKHFARYREIFKKHRILFISVALQSASARLMKLMNRKYDPALVMKKINILKKISPQTKFATHLMIGFPTETEVDFSRTIKLAEAFDRVAFAIYKPTPGTEAIKLPPVDERKKKDRFKRLIDFCRGNPARAIAGLDEGGFLNIQ